jgi:hypothetical protein
MRPIPKELAQALANARSCLNGFEADVEHDRIGLAAKRAVEAINETTKLAIWCHHRQRESTEMAQNGRRTDATDSQSTHLPWRI